MACPAPFAKIFLFRLDPNQFTDSRRPVPTEGRCARHQRGAGCGGRERAKDDGAVLRTAKSCGSDAPRPASSLREEAQATVPTKPGHRREHEISRKTIARGMPGDFRCDRGDYARVLYLISRARLRVHWASGIPCALGFLGANGFCKTRAHRAARMQRRT